MYFLFIFMYLKEYNGKKHKFIPKVENAQMFAFMW